MMMNVSYTWKRTPSSTIPKKINRKALRYIFIFLSNLSFCHNSYFWGGKENLIPFTTNLYSINWLQYYGWTCPTTITHYYMSMMKLWGICTLWQEREMSPMISSEYAFNLRPPFIYFYHITVAAIISDDFIRN